MYMHGIANICSAWFSEENISLFPIKSLNMHTYNVSVYKCTFSAKDLKMEKCIMSAYLDVGAVYYPTATILYVRALVYVCM